LIFLSLYVFVFFEVYTVEGYSPGGLVTHNLSSLPGFVFFVISEPARLVIRRAVEMKNPRFVGCSWFIGLIGLGSEFPEKKYFNYSMPPHLSPSPRP
jgi:hypothetical protein